MTNATPYDVFNTTEAVVMTEEPTDGTIATGLYEVEKYRAIVRLVLKFEKEEKKE